MLHIDLHGAKENLTSHLLYRILPMVIVMKPIVLPGDVERKLVEVFAALGNPARMHILEILAQHPEHHLQRNRRHSTLLSHRCQRARGIRSERRWLDT